jgi:hypothetical protein
MKKVIPILLLLFIVQTAQAQIVKVEITPQTLLPNDVADCKLTFTAQQTTYVSGITIFHSTEIQVSPSSFSGIGWLSAGNSYEFPFTIKAKKSGIYTLTIYINTLNGTIKQSLTIRVVRDKPDIILDKTVLTLNEVNTIQFTITSPIDIDNVVVEPSLMPILRSYTFRTEKDRLSSNLRNLNPLSSRFAFTTVKITTKWLELSMLVTRKAKES